MFQLDTQEEQDIQLITSVIDRVALPIDQKIVLQKAWLRVCARKAEADKRHERRNHVLKLVQEALGQLRLDLKYLTFDLGATRRERDALREKLNNDRD